MSRLLRTAALLIADVRNRSGLEANTFRTDADILRYLEESAYKLYGMIQADHPDSYYLYASDTISVVSGTTIYVMPDYCFKPICFRVTVGGQRINIPRADIDEIDTEVSNAGWDLYGNYPRHRMLGYNTTSPGELQVMFVPTPTASYTVTVHFIPQKPFFYDDTADVRSDSLDAAKGAMTTEWNWEEWAVLDAAIKIKNDQEEDPRALQQERHELWQMITKQAESRVESEPARTRDAYSGWRIDEQSRNRRYPR